MLKEPIFIVGTVRSSTTLLAQCLDCHPDVTWVYVPELGSELVRQWCDWGGVEMGVDFFGRPHCCPAGQSDASDSARTLLQQGFTALLAERGGGRFLNKNPHLWNKLPFLRAVFPDARLVVVSRDLRSTTLSTQMLWIKTAAKYHVKHYLPAGDRHCWSVLSPGSAVAEPERTFPGGSLSVLAEYWLRAYSAIEADIRAFQEPLKVIHSELLARPRETMRNLLEQLRLDPDRMGKLPSLDLTRNDRWRSLLTRKEKDTLEEYIEAHREPIAALKWADTTL